MQKFTRAITREIDLAGERLAVTFDAQGISVRPVGSRKPPHAMSWGSFLRCLHSCATSEASADQVATAVRELRSAPTGSTAGSEQHSGGEAPAPAEHAGAPHPM